MKIHKVKDQLYDGAQLHHAFCYENGGPLGASITYFRGPAAVKDHLVDIEDRLADDFIKSKDMWHFIIEIPGASLTETVLWQRLFITKYIDWIRSASTFRISRDGDDIMVEGDNPDEAPRKLSVSIATLSRFSGLIHVGINIEVGKGCPVPAIGLMDIGIDTRFSEYEPAENFVEEYKDILNATYKVSEVS